MISSILPPSSFFEAIYTKFKKESARFTFLCPSENTVNVDLSKRKITYDNNWKKVLNQLEVNQNKSWENSKNELFKLFEETEPAFYSDLKIYFSAFLKTLDINETLTCLKSLFLHSIDNDLTVLQEIGLETIDIEIFNEILRKKERPYDDIVSWAKTLTKARPIQSSTSIQAASQSSTSTSLITSFFPNFSHIFFRAFSLFDSARPPESLYEYGVLATLYFHFFSMPYYLFIGLSQVIANPWIVLAVAATLLGISVASLYTYLKFFKTCPKEVMYCENITSKFHNGELEPVLNCDKTYAKVKQILSMGEKRKGGNVVLVGRPGVGKTEFMNGLAEKFPEFQVFKFKNWALFGGGGSVLGPGEKMDMALNETAGFEDQVLFCYDELGDGIKNSGFADYLKLVLPTKKVRFVTAMTAEQWEKFQSENSEKGLAERFCPVYLKSTDQNKTKNILMNRVKLYVNDISVSNEALDKIIELTQKDETAHAQPRAAIRKLDELVGKARQFTIEKYQSPKLIKAKNDLNHLYRLSVAHGGPFNNPLSSECQTHLANILKLKTDIKQLKSDSEKVKQALFKLKKHLDLLRFYEEECKLLGLAISQGKCDEIAKKRFAFINFIAIHALTKKIQTLKKGLPPETSKVCLYIDAFQVEHFLAEKPVFAVR